MIKFMLKNLPFAAKQDEVKELHQDISQVDMKRGYAVVTLTKDAKPEEFSSEVDGTKLGNRVLTVAPWEDRPPRPQGDRGERSHSRGRSERSDRPQGGDQGRSRSRSSSQGRVDRGPRGPRVTQLRTDVLVLAIPSVESFLEAYGYSVTESDVLATFKPTNSQPLVGCAGFDPAVGVKEPPTPKKKGYKKTSVSDVTSVVQKRCFGVVTAEGQLITRSTAKDEGEEVLAKIKGANIPAKDLLFLRFEGEAAYMSVFPLISGLEAKMDTKLILSRIYQVSQGAQELSVFKLREWPQEDDVVISEEADEEAE